MKRAAALLALALALTGCAVRAPAPVVAPAPPPPVAPAPAAQGAVNDSVPTPEALAVLATIPEPLGGVSEPAPPEAYDTLRTDMPVPAPTRPLATTAPLPAELPPAVAVPLAAAMAAEPDTCWRVQIAAPSEREKGKALRDAAESLLMVPMLVDREGGRFKVRSRDCLSRSSAEALKARALDSGFQGAFLVRLPGTH